MVARYLVFVIVARADAKMEGLIALLLLGTFFEAGALASEPELDEVLQLIVGGALAANLNYSLHVAALRADEPASNLELLVVLYLNVESARVLDIFVLHAGSTSLRLLLALLRLVCLLLLCVRCLLSCLRL